MRDMISWLAQGVAMNYAKNVQLRTGNSALLCFAEPAAQQSHTGCRGWSCWGDGPAGVSLRTNDDHPWVRGWFLDMGDDADCRGDRRPRDPDSTSYTGAIEGTEEFGRRICAEAWGRGWNRALKRVVLGDGAE